MKSFWKEIRNDYIEDENTNYPDDQEGDVKRLICIDAWKSDNDNENGEVIAKVILTTHNDLCVVYVDNLARTDEYAQQMINEAKEIIKQ